MTVGLPVTTCSKLSLVSSTTAISVLQERTQHPRVLLMDLHALREQVRRGFVAGLVHRGEELARGAGDGFLPLDEQSDHLLRIRDACGFPDRRELCVLRIRARRIHAERADALRDGVEGEP